jgi:hypothetical protein
MVMVFLPGNISANNSAHGIWGVGIQIGFVEYGASQNADRNFLLTALRYARELALASNCIPTNEIDDLITAMQNTSNSRSLYNRMTQYRQNLAVYVLNNCDCSTPNSPSEPVDDPATIIPGRYYKLINKNSGKVLDIGGGRKDNGGMAMQWADSSGESTFWQLVSAGNGYYKIVNKNSGKFLAISSGSKNNGGNAIQWSDQGQSDIYWQFIPAGDGYYKIVNKNSGKVLAISSGSKKNGAYAIQWSDQGQLDIYWRMDLQ